MANASVFLIDGDPAVRDSLTTLLDLNGYDVHAYATGAAFIKTFNDTAHEQIHCVICEAELPDTSGIRLYHTLQQAQLTAPFALLISRRNQATLRKARAAGIDSIFPKPLVYQNLLRFVSSAQLREDTN